MKPLIKFLTACGLQHSSLYRFTAIQRTPTGYANFLRRFVSFYHFGQRCQVALDTKIDTPESVFVGDGVHLDGCKLHAGDGFLNYSAPCYPEDIIVIGSYAYIGPGAEIYPGVAIGTHAKVMPGVVVTSDVEDYAVVYRDQDENTPSMAQSPNTVSATAKPKNQSTEELTKMLA